MRGKRKGRENCVSLLSWDETEAGDVMLSFVPSLFAPSIEHSHWAGLGRVNHAGVFISFSQVASRFGRPGYGQSVDLCCAASGFPLNQA